MILHRSLQHQETNIGNEEGEKEQIQDKSIRNPPTEVEVSSYNTAEEYVILDKETAVSEEEATGEDVLEVTRPMIRAFFIRFS